MLCSISSLASGEHEQYNCDVLLYKTNYLQSPYSYVIQCYKLLQASRAENTCGIIVTYCCTRQTTYKAHTVMLYNATSCYKPHEQKIHAV